MLARLYVDVCHPDGREFHCTRETELPFFPRQGDSFSGQEYEELICSSSDYDLDNQFCEVLVEDVVFVDADGCDLQIEAMKRAGWQVNL